MRATYHSDKIRNALALGLCATLAFTCPALAQGLSDSGFPYDLSNPFFTVTLSSADLKEVSGLSLCDGNGQYLAIADEKGMAYVIDASSGHIERSILFREKGDFEGIERVGANIYAVKSNGDIYEIRRWKRASRMRVQEYETPLTKADDVEGLGYDPKRKALLLACKGDPDSAYTRKIYAWDLKSKQLSPDAVYSIDPAEVNALLPKLPEEKNNFFSPSGLAIHPQTSDIYVISTAQKRLVVLDYTTGKLRYAIRLDKSILPQPEGIAFDRDGNLLISSEGKKGSGMVLKYKPR